MTADYIRYRDWSFQQSLDSCDEEDDEEEEEMDSDVLYERRMERDL